MTVRLKSTDSIIQIRWIPRYTSLERLLHWVHSASFIPLVLTGFILFSPFLQAGAGSVAVRNVRILHRIAAVVFGATPIIYGLVQPRRLIMHVREFLTFCRYDIEWFKAAVPYYLLGRHVAMPPQPRFNTGERLNALVMIVGTAVFGVSGLGMWFGKGLLPPNLFLALLILHDLAFIGTLAMFIVHFYLAVIHPMMWQSLVSMRFGYVSESYAREHHARWYYGPDRAIQLWEQGKTAGGGDK
jgi:formate dehydrogenase subunit gamma